MADLQMYRGDTQKFDLVVSRNNTPVDITGAKLWFSARRSIANPGYIFQETTDTGITITDAATGQAQIRLSNLDTAGLPPEDTVLQYDVQILEQNGDIWTVVEGKLTVLCDVTTEVS